MKIIPHFSAEGLSNEYLIVDDEENGIIVDPAHVDGELLEIIEKMCNRLVAVLITHKHQSHTAGLGTLLKIYNLDVYAFEKTINGIKTIQFKDGETKRIGSLNVKALLIPGHSMDSLVYSIDGAIFTGDTLSSGSVAMTESFVEKELLIKSLERKIMCLPDNTLIFPGHGAPSKLRIEKMLNQDMLESEAATTGKAYRLS